MAVDRRRHSGSVPPEPPLLTAPGAGCVWRGLTRTAAPSRTAARFRDNGVAETIRTSPQQISRLRPSPRVERTPLIRRLRADGRTLTVSASCSPERLLAPRPT